jgi:hypothetical protein
VVVAVIVLRRRAGRPVPDPCAALEAASANATTARDDARSRAREARDQANALARDVSVARRRLDDARLTRQAAERATDANAATLAREAEDAAQANAYEVAKVASAADTAAGAAENRVDEASFRADEAEASWRACTDQRDGVEPATAGGPNPG